MINENKHLEQLFSSGLKADQIPFYFEYSLNDIPKSLIKIAKEREVELSESLVKNLKHNIDAHYIAFQTDFVSLTDKNLIKLFTYEKNFGGCSMIKGSMIKGDKIKLIKNIGIFTNVGEICEVVGVTTDGIIGFKFGNGMHLGCMSYDEFEKYFELVESKRVWGEWYTYFTTVKCYNITISIPVEVRTNGKIIQVRYKLPNDTYIKSQASCYKSDKFSFDKGRFLAEKRLVAKIFISEAKNYAANL